MSLSYTEFVERAEAITPNWRAVREHFYSDAEFLDLLPYAVRDPYSPVFKGHKLRVRIWSLFNGLVDARRKANDRSSRHGRLSHSPRIRAIALKNADAMTANVSTSSDEIKHSWWSPWPKRAFLRNR